MSLLKVHITFDPSVTGADAALATHKYNKQGAFCFQFDDGSPGIFVADTLWDTYTYTDGCGNNKNYKGSVGMNHGTGVPGSADYNAGYLQGPDLLNLISKGHDIENHSYYHTGNTDGLSGSPAVTDEDRQKALISLMLEDDVINKYTAYWMRGFIIPQNFTCFDEACLNLNKGYLTCISEGTDPFFEGQGTAGGTIYQGNFPDAAFNVPAFFRITRLFNDNWQDLSSQNEARAAFDDLVANNRNIVCLFSHSALGSDHLPNFTTFYDYLHSNAADKILFASLREVAEYSQMKNITLHRNLEGNVLTVYIDTNELDQRQRWRDISLNVTADASITGVSVEGFDSYSYNAATKLVNAFSQKTSWGSLDPGPTPDPVQQILLKHGNFTSS